MLPPVITTLLEIIERLHRETEGFQAHPEDSQLWYNRGYADGVVTAMDKLGYGALLDVSVEPLSDSQAHLPWGKAYLHGFEMGAAETREVLPPAGEG